MTVIIPGIPSPICWLLDAFKLHALWILLLWLHQDARVKSSVQNWNLIKNLGF